MSIYDARQAMLAVLADPLQPGELALREVPLPSRRDDQALIRVHAISLNAGETRTALIADRSYIPGWDFAGVIEEPAADGSSQPRGTRVFGIVPAGAWAQYVAVSASMMAALSDSVSFSQAAALPIAAITPLRAQRLAGDITNKDVLITGAAGGVGRYACQLAAHAGARVHAISRRPRLEELLRKDHVDLVRLFPTMDDAVQAGDYDYILESVGGPSLGRALGSLKRGGVCVSCGNSSDQKTTFEPRDFYLKADTRLHGLYLGSVFVDCDASSDLAEIQNLVASGKLSVPIGDERSWNDIQQAALDLKGQSIDGKIILHVH
ncbi:zinc-binding dehydrogenase [Mesorhizobium sp. 1B3]|uniref:zinc-binding dehydrogenase n=1 Tax=Mesorhizobium sp. 1B3 TaxID=3243599 RepID=UPI003D96038A